MNPSWRKPAGIGLILLLVLVWCVAIVSVSEAINSMHWIVQALFYTVAGIAWIMPLKPLLRWMELGPRHK